MVEKASADLFNRYTLDNGMVLWFVTEDKIGKSYADGIDNNGDGDIDERIDIGIDDEEEAWIDGIDNGGETCEDPPGIRDVKKLMGTNMYLAYLRDPSGNKLCALKRMD